MTAENNPSSKKEDKKEADKAPRVQVLADYLVSSKKKRKNYVILALSPHIRSDIVPAIQSFLKNHIKNVAITQPKNVEDLRKQFLRQVVLLIYDDEFTSMDDGLKIIEEFKLRKTNDTPPVLFLTRQPETLVTAYHDKLMAFHEIDDYVNYVKTPINHILIKIKDGITLKNRRRSRRYKVELPVTYQSISSDQTFKGELIDLSIHGALIKSNQDQLFRLGDQIRISIPVGVYLPPVAGDFFKLSAKVRRVFIAGDQAGISFEHVSEHQREQLTKFVTEIVKNQYRNTV